jgi:hypothetical protein
MQSIFAQMLRKILKENTTLNAFASQCNHTRAASRSATCLCESVLQIRLRPDFSVVFGGYPGEAEHWPSRQEARKRFLKANILRTS